MNQAKMFITFTFLLAFAFCVSAQEQTPKIIWQNLKAEYEKIEDIEPFMSIEGEKPIFVYYFPHLIITLRFNEQTKNWEKQNPYLCGYAANEANPVKLTPKKKIPVDFYKDAIVNFSPSPFMPYLESKNQQILKARYKFRIHYGLNKSDIHFISESPEFEFIEFKPE